MTDTAPASQREDEPHDRIATLLAAGAVVVTLLAALAGFLLDRSSGAADAASTRAEQLAIASAGRHASDLELAQDMFDRYREMTAERRRAASARGRMLFAQDAGLRESARLDYERHSKIAAGLTARTKDVAAALGSQPLDLDADSGPRLDPFFPNRHFIRADYEAVRLLAQRDAQSWLSSQHRGRTGKYALAVTLLAISVFFFGFSVTPQGRAQRSLFGSSAVLFMAAGVTLILALFVSRPAAPSVRAGDAYAQGWLIAQSGVEADFPRGVALLDEAIRLFPEHPAAYFQRARLRVAVAQHGGRILARAPRGAAEDVRIAMRLGYRDVWALANLSQYEALQAMEDKDTAALGDAERLALESDAEWKRIRGKDVCRPCILIRVAFAQLAARGGHAADAKVRELAGHIRFADPAKKLLRDAQGVRNLVMESLAEFDVVATKMPSRAAAVSGAKELLLKQLGDPARRAPQAVAPLKAVASVGSQSLAVTVDARGVAPGTTADVLWFRDGGSGAWDPLPDISGSAKIERGHTTIDRPWVSHPPQIECLRAGAYRVDVYIAGTKVASAVARGGNTGAQSISRSLPQGGADVAICAPAGWTAAEPSQPMLISTFISGDRHAGLAFVRSPADVLGLQSSDLFAHRAISAFRAVIPQPATPLRPFGFSRAPLFEEKRRSIRRYEYAGGSAVVIDALDERSGDFLTMVAWGPAPWFDHAGLDIVRSLTVFGGGP